MKKIIISFIFYHKERVFVKMGYNTCPDCGANLDPGEKCDCEEEEKLKEEIKPEA